MHEDIREMKHRAQNNMTFIYVKVRPALRSTADCRPNSRIPSQIPGIFVCVSYKAEEKDMIRDLHRYQLTTPTEEYHSQTCTWFDMISQYKSDITTHVVKQVPNRPIDSSWH